MSHSAFSITTRIPGSSVLYTSTSTLQYQSQNTNQNHKKKKKKSDLRVSRNEKLTHVKQLREVPHLQPTTRDQTHLKNDVHNSPPFLNSIS
jgi:hypothetical protein